MILLPEYNENVTLENKCVLSKEIWLGCLINSTTRWAAGIWRIPPHPSAGIFLKVTIRHYQRWGIPEGPKIPAGSKQAEIRSAVSTSPFCGRQVGGRINPARAVPELVQNKHWATPDAFSSALSVTDHVPPAGRAAPRPGWIAAGTTARSSSAPLPAQVPLRAQQGPPQPGQRGEMGSAYSPTLENTACVWRRCAECGFPQLLHSLHSFKLPSKLKCL